MPSFSIQANRKSERVDDDYQENRQTHCYHNKSDNFFGWHNYSKDRSLRQEDWSHDQKNNYQGQKRSWHKVEVPLRPPRKGSANREWAFHNGTYDTSLPAATASRR